VRTSKQSAKQRPNGPDSPARGSAGHFDAVRPAVLEEWKALGEVGQYLAGRFMGYSKQEIMDKRGWTLAEADEFELKASVWLAKNRKGGKK
jgi:hypothetical protein